MRVKEMSEGFNTAMTAMLKKVEEIIKRIQNEGSKTKRLLILVSAQCKFCSEYLEKLKVMDLGVVVRVYNIFASEEGQALALLLRTNNFPATVFLGVDDKIKGVIYGIPEEQELRNEIEKL